MTAIDLSKRVSDKLINRLCQQTNTDDYQFAYMTQDSVDPDTGQWTPGVEVIKSFNAYEQTRFALNADTNIQKGDIFIGVSPLLDIPNDAYFYVRGERYSYEDKTPIYNAGALQLNRFQLRRS